MRILVIRKDLPWPLCYGGRLHGYELCRRLAERHELLVVAERDGERPEKGFPFECVVAGEMIVRHTAKMAVAHTGKTPVPHTGKMPAPHLGRVERFFGVNPRFTHELMRLVGEWRPDVVVGMGYLSLAHLGKITDTPTICDLGDDEALHRLLELLRGRSGSRWADLKCLAATLVYQRRYIRRVSAVTVLSQADRRFCRLHTGHWRIECIPHGVDCNYYRPDFPLVPRHAWSDEPENSSPAELAPSASEWVEGKWSTDPSLALRAGNATLSLEHAADSELFENPNRIIFWGGLEFGPNVSAILFFAERVWPVIRRNRPDLRWVIAGWGNPPELEKVRRMPGVTFTGYVDDLRPYVAASAVAVVPMVSGAGIKNKIMEAWAMGKSVVCTPRALGGLPGVHGENAWIARSPRGLAQGLLMLLDRPALRRAMGEAARRTAVTHCSWDRAALQLERLCREVGRFPVTEPNKVSDQHGRPPSCAGHPDRPPQMPDRPAGEPACGRPGIEDASPGEQACVEEAVAHAVS